MMVHAAQLSPLLLIVLLPIIVIVVAATAISVALVVKPGWAHLRLHSTIMIVVPVRHFDK